MNIIPAVVGVLIQNHHPLTVPSTRDHRMNIIPAVSDSLSQSPDWERDVFKKKSYYFTKPGLFFSFFFSFFAFLFSFIVFTGAFFELFLVF
jgi:hypothetical protein